MNINDQISLKAFELLEALLFGTVVTPELMAAIRAEATEFVYRLDETNDCKGAARAAFVAQSRELRDATLRGLTNDYNALGNAWPFSGDHLGTVDVRSDFVLNGEWVSGDVIGRERAHTADYINVWAAEGVRAI